ncbi:MAG: LptF/LptG family permease [Chloroherpetonaceae bacterium]|nr:LptF/LptG family permease [Chloroherpetonaceae bacterium]
MKILTRYILKQHIAPFIFAFSTVIFVFTVQFLTRTLDRLVGKGLPIETIVELVVLQMAWMVVLAAPMASLVATLMTFGNLTSSLEMTAIRAGGISLWRVLVPVMVAGLVLTYLAERFGNIILPEANHRAKVLMMDISRQKPAFALKDNVFSDMIYGYAIMARKTVDTTSKLYGITIYDYSQPNVTALITADSAEMEFSSDGNHLLMTLYQGEMHEIDRDTRLSYRKVSFYLHRVLFDATGYSFERSDESSVSRGDRELSASDMLAICDSLTLHIKAAQQTFQQNLSEFLRELILPSALFRDSLRAQLDVSPEHLSRDVDSVLTDLAQHTTTNFSLDSLGYLRRIAGERREAAVDYAITILRNNMTVTSSALYTIDNQELAISAYMVEVHKKYALPFACFFFVLVGVPLGVLAKRGGFGVGAGLSLIFFLLYWVFLIGGEKLADRQLISPAVAMWSGNVAILLVGIVLLIRASGVELTGWRRTKSQTM